MVRNSFDWPQITSKKRKSEYKTRAYTAAELNQADSWTTNVQSGTNAERAPFGRSRLRSKSAPSRIAGCDSEVSCQNRRPTAVRVSAEPAAGISAAPRWRVLRVSAVVVVVPAFPGVFREGSRFVRRRGNGTRWALFGAQSATGEIVDFKVFGWFCWFAFLW